MKDSQAAFKWIIGELEKRHIPFALVGGIAANAYGTTRPLNDIDIDVPDNMLYSLARVLKDYLVFGPENSLSECFDCQLIGFKFCEQDIELSGAETLRIKDLKSGEWLHWPTNLNDVETKIVFGLEVPVMSKKSLIAYKKLAGRETDLIDVSQLESTT
jgi:hypothetical protein